MGHDRWLVFSWYQLSKRYNIVLYYSPPGKDVQVGANQLHVACHNCWSWRWISLSAMQQPLRCRESKGPSRQSVLCQLDRVGAWQSSRSTVRNIDRPSMQVRNGTEESEDLVLGIIRTLGSYPISIFESSFVWKAVRPKHGITMNFDPTLCAIVSEEYRESEIIMTPVKPEQVIWRQNVGKLEEATYLELLEDDDEGLIIRKTE
ncbi:hypothetical protein BC835DRAFT_700350 [Cytidiella melzeri]|nr:hypothetical protein BC835DRAFT_700350 [Cytidiella melzeri]